MNDNHGNILTQLDQKKKQKEYSKNSDPSRKSHKDLSKPTKNTKKRHQYLNSFLNHPTNKNNLQSVKMTIKNNNAIKGPPQVQVSSNKSNNKYLKNDQKNQTNNTKTSKPKIKNCNRSSDSSSLPKTDSKSSNYNINSAKLKKKNKLHTCVSMDIKNNKKINNNIKKSGINSASLDFKHDRVKLSSGLVALPNIAEKQLRDSKTFYDMQRSAVSQRRKQYENLIQKKKKYDIIEVVYIQRCWRRKVRLEKLKNLQKDLEQRIMFFKKYSNFCTLLNKLYYSIVARECFTKIKNFECERLKRPQTKLKDKTRIKNNYYLMTKERKIESNIIKKIIMTIQNNYRIHLAKIKKNKIYMNSRKKVKNHKGFVTKTILNKKILNEKLNVIMKKTEKFLSNKKTEKKKQNIIRNKPISSEVSNNIVSTDKSIKIYCKKSVFYVSKINLINEERKLIVLQRTIKAFLKIKKLRQFYKNSKYIKKSNINKLYFFTKKLSNENNDMFLIKKLQKYFKKRFSILKKNIITNNMNTNLASDYLSFQSQTSDEKEVVLKLVKEIRLNFISKLIKNSQNSQNSKKNNICIIINENKVYNNEEEKNDENEIIDSDENKLKNKNINKTGKNKKKKKNVYVTVDKSGLLLSQLIQRNRIPISRRKGNYIDKVRVYSNIINEYTKNYLLPKKLNINIILNNSLLITKSRIRNNEKEIIYLQKFFLNYKNLKNRKLIYYKPNEQIAEKNNNEIFNVEIDTQQQIKEDQDEIYLNNIGISSKYISLITKKNIINVENLLIKLQRKIKSFLLIKKLRQFYKNSKYIKKSNINKLYFFTKKLSNENNDMFLIKKLQKYFKKRFSILKKNIITNNMNTNLASDYLSFQSQTSDEKEVVLKLVKEIRLNFISKLIKNSQNSQNSKKNNICIIINENKVYNNEEEKNDENEIIDSDENKLKNKNINKTGKNKKKKKNVYVTVDKSGLLLSQLIQRNRIPISRRKGNYIDKVRVYSNIINEYTKNYLLPKKLNINIILNNSLLITKSRIRNNEKEIIQIQNAFRNYKSNIISNEIYQIPLISVYKLQGTELQSEEINPNSSEKTPTKKNRTKRSKNESNSVTSRKNINSAESSIFNSFSSDEDENEDSEIEALNPYEANYRNIVGQKIISLYNKNEIQNQPHLNMNNYYYMSKQLFKKKTIEKGQKEYERIKAEILERQKIEETKRTKIENQNNSKNEILIISNPGNSNNEKHSCSEDENIDGSFIQKCNKIFNKTRSQDNIHTRNVNINIMHNFTNIYNNGKNNYKFEKDNSKDSDSKSEEILYQKIINRNCYYSKKRYFRLKLRHNIKEQYNNKRYNNYENSANKFLYVKPHSRICYIKKERKIINDKNKINTNNCVISFEYIDNESKNLLKKIDNNFKINKSLIKSDNNSSIIDKNKNLLKSKNFQNKDDIKKFISLPSYNNYLYFIRLLNLFISKNVNELTFYKLKTQKKNDKNIDFKFPIYVTSLQRIFRYLQKEKTHPSSKKILDCLIEIFNDKNFLNKNFFKLITEITPEYEQKLINTNIFNGNEKNDLIKFAINFAKSDKKMKNDKFITERINQTFFFFKNTNIITLIKFIDEEFYKLNNNYYCLKCFNNIKICLCSTRKKDIETDEEFDSHLSLEMNEGFNEPIIINSFGYGTNSIIEKSRANNNITEMNKPQFNNKNISSSQEIKPKYNKNDNSKNEINKNDIYNNNINKNDISKNDIYNNDISKNDINRIDINKNYNNKNYNNKNDNTKKTYIRNSYDSDEWDK